MEARRVQQVGHATLVVSLPKEWVRSVGIKRGDVVTFKPEADGTLKVVPGLLKTERKSSKIIIYADSFRERGLLARVLTGNYVVGKDTIYVLAKKRLRPEHMDEVREVTRRLTGVGIVEQTLNQVTLQSFVDSGKFPFQKSVKRFQYIITSMHHNIFRAISERNLNAAAEVLYMKEEVSRLYWLMLRQLILSAQDEETRCMIGIRSPPHLLGDRAVAKSLERMADRYADMAKTVSTIVEKEGKIDQSILEGFRKLGNSVHLTVNDSIRAFLIPDVQLANRILEEIRQVDAQLDDLNMTILARSGKAETATHLLAMARKLGLVVDDCSTISEVAINRALEDFEGGSTEAPARGMNEETLTLKIEGLE